MNKRMYKSRKNRMIAGVAGGIAEYIDVDPTLIRLAFVLLVFAGASGIIIYIVLAIILPEQESIVPPASSSGTPPADIAGQPAPEVAPDFSPRRYSESRNKGAQVIGLGIIALGILFLLINFGVFSWLEWGVIWPVVLIAIGLLLILGRARR